MTPGKYRGLTRIADHTGRFKMLATDQRPPIESLVRDGTGNVDAAAVAAIKDTLIEVLGPHSSAVLMDPQYSFPHALPLVGSACGLLLTLEYDRYEETASGRLSGAIPDWDVSKIKLSGADGVKVLAWYRPDASQKVNAHQREFVADVGASCSRLDIPFVFELLVYPFPGEAPGSADYVEHPAKQAEMVIESVQEFSGAEYAVDVFKLESPFPVKALTAGTITASEMATAFQSLNEAAGRPWVLLSAGAGADDFYDLLGHALDAGASGYLAGRAIWWDQAKDHSGDPAMLRQALGESAVPYIRRLNSLTDERALPWFEHPRFATLALDNAGPDFRRRYGADG